MLKKNNRNILKTKIVLKATNFIQENETIFVLWVFLIIHQPFPHFKKKNLIIYNL
jgi:hypothetical protein